VLRLSRSYGVSHFPMGEPPSFELSCSDDSRCEEVSPTRLGEFQFGPAAKRRPEPKCEAALWWDHDCLMGGEHQAEKRSSRSRASDDEERRLHPDHPATRALATLAMNEGALSGRPIPFGSTRTFSASSHVFGSRSLACGKRSRYG